MFRDDENLGCEKFFLWGSFQCEVVSLWVKFKVSKVSVVKLEPALYLVGIVLS